jgi:hypothetical protein
MMAGRELKLNHLPPMENSFTRADAAARLFSRSSAKFSNVSIAGQIVNRKSEIVNEKWRARRDSNARPPAWNLTFTKKELARQMENVEADAIGKVKFINRRRSVFSKAPR